MRTKLMTAMALLIVLAAFGCKTAATHTPGELDPTVIEAAVRTQIAQEFPSETFSIGVSVTDEGVVTLDGTVDTANQAKRIAEETAEISGVTRVINSLRWES